MGRQVGWWVSGRHAEGPWRGHSRASRYWYQTAARHGLRRLQDGAAGRGATSAGRCGGARGYLTQAGGRAVGLAPGAAARAGQAGPLGGRAGAHLAQHVFVEGAGEVGIDVLAVVQGLPGGFVVWVRGRGFRGLGNAHVGAAMCSVVWRAAAACKAPGSAHAGRLGAAERDPPLAAAPGIAWPSSGVLGSRAAVAPLGAGPLVAAAAVPSRGHPALPSSPAPPPGPSPWPPLSPRT